MITYFDEVKYQQGQQPYYWLGGLCTGADDIWSLESRVSDLAQSCFGTSTLSATTEFHAAEIFHRKRNFKNWPDVAARIDVIKKLIDIINDHGNVGRIYVRICPDLMLAEDYERKAFMFFVEKVESFLQDRKSPGILIGDRESDKISNDFSEVLSHWRNFGTEYHYGVKLNYLIDTVHFTDSHHSRMLQLADLYVWLLQLCDAPSTSHPKSLILDHVRANNRVVSPNRHKHWPTQQSWLRKA